MKKTEEILKKIKKIEIKTRSLVSERLLGGYHSTFRGQGVEFSEVSEYQYGDDVRSIDWNVTARLGNPYIKKYVEERELSINLLVDVSKSMEYGSKEYTKRELAAEIGGIIAYSALMNQDKVGLLLVSDKVEFYLPPVKGRKNLLRILREILYFEPESKNSNILKGIEFLSSVHTRKQVIFVLSDFFDFSPDNIVYKTAKKRHEIIPIIINDKREKDMVDSGILVVEDLESDSIGILPAKNIKKIWENRFIAEKQRLFKEFNRLGQSFIEIDDERDIVPSLQRFFGRR